MLLSISAARLSKSKSSPPSLSNGSLSIVDDAELAVRDLTDDEGDDFPLRLLLLIWALDLGFVTDEDFDTDAFGDWDDDEHKLHNVAIVISCMKRRFIVSCLVSTNDLVKCSAMIMILFVLLWRSVVIKLYSSRRCCMCVVVTTKCEIFKNSKIACLYNFRSPSTNFSQVNCSASAKLD